MSTEAQVIQDISDYARNFGGSYSNWYVGIAANPRDRLFNAHNVSEHSGSWICRRCSSAHEARSVEKYFIVQGMTGGSGGGDHNTTAVYAYKITSTTRE